MKKIHVLSMMLFLILGTGCMSTSQLMKVEEGMSRQEITKIFGTPEFRRFDRGIEEWEYRKLIVLTGEVKVTVITFDDGKVSGMNSFNVAGVQQHPAPLPCTH